MDMIEKILKVICPNQFSFLLLLLFINIRSLSGYMEMYKLSYPPVCNTSLPLNNGSYAGQIYHYNHNN